MKNRSYKIKRDDVFVGTVVRATSKIYRYNGTNNFFRTKPGELELGSWRHYRNMLFVPNEEHDLYSSDLLYDSPEYPVLNVTDDNICLNLEPESVVIRDAYNLSMLLQHYGFKDTLSLEDLIRIRHTFFNGKFAEDNCKLFGYKETMAEDLTFYENGEEITDPRKLEKKRREYRAEQLAGYRMFTSIPNNDLPRELFDVLNYMGDHTLFDVLTDWEDRMDAFKPSKEEGKIKRLKPINRR